MAPSVLIVDDDPVIQLLLRVNFEMEGFVVATADDGVQGLQMAREMQPGVVLLDVVMPKLDGYEVLSEIRRDDTLEHLPVVLLSARSSDADRSKGTEAGADAYVTKPFEPAKLLSEVKTLLESRGLAS